MSNPVSQFVTAQDGLKLHVRAYGAHVTSALPVVCLPGLARTGADFHRLASALADDREHPRYVLALDYRGRGLSDYDSNPDNYSLAVELADVLVGPHHACDRQGRCRWNLTWRTARHAARLGTTGRSRWRGSQ
jgi:pimeloyl-ACP methyl ester carboxylesterase